MKKYTTIDYDYSSDLDWEDEDELNEREAEKNKYKNKHAIRKLNVKRRMDDYMESKKARHQARYLDSFEEFRYD